MGEFMFGSGTGELTEKAYEQINAIAEKHECVIHNPNMPGEGPRYWFAGPNLGNPFDQAMRDAVYHDLREAELMTDENELSGSCFEDDE